MLTSLVGNQAVYAIMKNLSGRPKARVGFRQKLSNQATCGLTSTAAATWPHSAWLDAATAQQVSTHDSLHIPHYQSPALAVTGDTSLHKYQLANLHSNKQPWIFPLVEDSTVCWSKCNMAVWICTHKQNRRLTGQSYAENIWITKETQFIIALIIVGRREQSSLFSPYHVPS